MRVDRAAPPLVAHVVHHFGTGGLENGLVHLINGTPPGRYRHALVCLADATDFVRRIHQPGVELIQLHRRAGQDWAVLARLGRTLRALRPAIVHTRNLSALEGQIPAALVSGARRVHGEHGRDVFDLAGANRKYNLLRRAIRPLVHRYVPVSRDLAEWLERRIGVEPERIRQIYNGVDPLRFSPRQGARPNLAPPGFLPDPALVVGTVGRLAGVKDQATLLDAFACATSGDAIPQARLVLVGDGPLRKDLEGRARALGIAGRVWFAGDRADVNDLMRLFDLFALPSLGEGISNTVLEAMASGLPVIATRVGGNPELVREGSTGVLVPPGDPEALGAQIARLLADADLRRGLGRAARERIIQGFSWERCVEQYLGVYDELLGRVADPALIGVGGA